MEEKREIALRTAIIATHFMYKKIKVGSEGLMLHYDICVDIAIKSLEKFPMDFDWEKFRDEKNGDDFDTEIEKFAEKEAYDKYNIDKTYFAE